MNELMNAPDVDDAEMRMIEQTGKRLLISNQIAETMCRASLLPEHLRTRKKEGVIIALDPVEIQANCVLIVNQALRWGVDPFAILPSTFVIAGRLGFDGKLVAAIVNRNGNLVEKLTYEFHGEGDGRTVIVSGRISGEDTPRTVEVSVGQAKTTNEIWTKDPDQKLVYTGATRWARRHCPQVMLGIVSDDEPIYETVEGRTAERPVVANRTCFKSYMLQLEAVTSPENLKAIIDAAQGEPLGKITESDVESLKTVGRMIYARLTKEAAAKSEPAVVINEPDPQYLLNQYQEDIEACQTRAEVQAQLVALNAEERIPIADRKAMSKWANELATKLK